MDEFIIDDFKKENIEDILKIESESGFSYWKKEMFLNEYKNKYSVFKTGKVNNIIVGYIIYYVLFEESEIFNIAVKTEYRNKSFGSQLLNYAVSDAAKRKVKKVFLEVSDKNIPAVTLYKKFGFEQYYERKNYYSNGDNALLMVKNINADFLTES